MRATIEEDATLIEAYPLSYREGQEAKPRGKGLAPLPKPTRKSTRRWTEESGSGLTPGSRKWRSLRGSRRGGPIHRCVGAFERGRQESRPPAAHVDVPECGACGRCRLPRLEE